MMANCEKHKVETAVNHKDIISKRRKIETIVKDKDIISKLPENILHHIISFLPTRCAVSTCILSKAWKDLWISTTKLSFSLESKEQITKYPSFIDHVLGRHSSNITSFYLDTSVWWSWDTTAPKLDLDATLVQSWISAAVNRQVQHVCLVLSSVPVLVTLPLCLCNSNMLTSLKVSTSCTLELPPKIYLPSLKILDLQHVKFSDNFAFNGLFSGLPNIEELKLVFGCSTSSLKNCTISLPTLQRLTLHDDGGIHHPSDCFVKVNAENLVYLNCKSSLNLDVNLHNLLSLAEAEIRIWCYKEEEKEAHRATNLLAGLSFAKSLKLAQRSLADLRRLSSEGNRNLFPRFVNLTALHIYSDWFKSLGVTSDSAPALMDIFRNAPILESVVIHDVRGGKWSRKPYPQCIEFSLKNCTILCFGGQREILRFVKFMLKAAKGLKCLKLYCTKELCKREKKLQDVMSELNLFPRVSESCVIEFVTR